jgi:hypothetical protein
MKQKNASPTKEQAQILQRNKKNPALYVVVRDLPYSLIIKHRESGEFEIISK